MYFPSSFLKNMFFILSFCNLLWYFVITSLIKLSEFTCKVISFSLLFLIIIVIFLSGYSYPSIWILFCKFCEADRFWGTIILKLFTTISLLCPAIVFLLLSSPILFNYIIKYLLPGLDPIYLILFLLKIYIFTHNK